MAAPGKPKNIALSIGNYQHFAHCTAKLKIVNPIDNFELIPSKYV